LPSQALISLASGPLITAGFRADKACAKQALTNGLAMASRIQLYVERCTQIFY
jgi:hypothetical protein